MKIPIYEVRQIAQIYNDFHEKFGIPRQSGLTKMCSKIVMEEEFSDPNALRGLEDFSHIWLIWGFSQVPKDTFSPTVRPPRLGGNIRKGVFATRSPFRPNRLGLSVVRLEAIEPGALIVSGADLMNGTPIFDIKPYIPYADSIPDASNGWSLAATSGMLQVIIPQDIVHIIPEDRREILIELLAQDPRPQYQNCPERLYTISYSDFEVSFRVENTKLYVVKIIKRG